MKTKRFAAVRLDTHQAVVDLRWLGLCLPAGVIPTKQLAVCGRSDKPFADEVGGVSIVDSFLYCQTKCKLCVMAEELFFFLCRVGGELCVMVEKGLSFYLVYAGM